MLSGYSIQEQTEGRGENKETVFIKTVCKGVNSDKTTGAITGMFPLKAASGKTLPCLRVVIGNDSPDHRFIFRWSNYYEQHDVLSPGKFKLVREDIGQPLFLYVKNLENRKLQSQWNKPLIDYVEMAMRYDSHFDKKTGWQFGEKQPYATTTEDMFEAESTTSAFSGLAEQFGVGLAGQVMGLFVTNELFSSFLIAPTEAEVSEQRRRFAAAA